MDAKSYAFPPFLRTDASSALTKLFVVNRAPPPMITFVHGTVNTFVPTNASASASASAREPIARATISSALCSNL